MAYKSVSLLETGISLIVALGSTRRNYSAMKSFGLFLISVALLACGEARQTGTPPANQPVPLTDLINQAQSHIEKLGQELRSNLNIPNQDAVIATLKNHTSTLATNVKSYVDEMTDKLKNQTPEMKNLWERVKTSLMKVADDVAAQVPVAKDQVAQLESKFSTGIDTIVKQSEIAAKTISRNSGQIQDDMAKLAKRTVELAVQATQDLNSQVQQFATAKPKA